MRAIATAYRQRGLDPAAALHAADIAPALLRRADGRITAAQLEAVCLAAMQELDDEALGWFTRRLPWGSYGLLCRASLGAPTLEVALKRWCRHHRLLTDDVTLSLGVDSGVATLEIDDTGLRAEGEARAFCLVTLLRYVHGYACWAIDSRVPFQGATFPHAAPRHAAAYALMFPGPVRFDAPRAGFSFDAAYLRLPLRRDEAALGTMLERALPLTVLQYRRDRLLVQRVRERLRHATAPETAATVAAALHVSVRTLHRQLRDEGASLQQLKDAARREHASELLLRTRRPLKQVAADVGFRNEKSFARAFRGWTGLAPGAYRAGSGEP